MKPTILAISCLIAFTVTGCASTPSPVLLDGPTALFSLPASGPRVATGWWLALKDPVLDQLMEKALAGNLSLKATAARLSSAERLAGAALFAVGPSTAASASRTRTDSRASKSPAAAPSGFVNSANFSVSWEAPLFGKLSATLASAAAQKDQVVWQAEAAKVSLASAVVRGYAQFQTSQQKLVSMGALLSLAEVTLRIQHSATAAGLRSEQDADTVLNQVLQYRAQLALLRAENAQIRDSLAVLCGETKLDVLSGAAPWKIISPAVLAVDPSHIRLRPDVRAAEETVLVAAAQVGLSRAALWPQLNLSAAANINPTSGGLISSTSGIGLSMPLLGWFALKAQADASVGQMNAAVSEYRQVVLNAWQEAQAAFADATAASDKMALATTQIDLGRAQVQRAESMERAGLYSKPEALSARMSQHSQDMSYADQYSQFVQSWARLQKAAFVAEVLSK